MTRSQGKNGSTRWVIQAVHIGDPDITSGASLALLAKKYYTLDRSIYSEWRMTRIRRKWMKKLMKTPDEEGGLTCAICGRKGLKPDERQDRNKQATLDHIHEIGKGGSWNDPINFQVACYPCNSYKNNVQQKKKVTS